MALRKGGSFLQSKFFPRPSQEAAEELFPRARRMRLARGGGRLTLICQSHASGGFGAEINSDA